MFRAVISDVSATEHAMLLPSKGALTPNGDVERVIGHKSHKKEVRSCVIVASVREVLRGLDT